MYILPDCLVCRCGLVTAPTIVHTVDALNVTLDTYESARVINSEEIVDNIW